jgi:CspA family cold shock protein
MARRTGTVLWFNNAKGFGFISGQSGPDVFVHYRAIQYDGYKSLKEGAVVEFDTVIGTDGRVQADWVVLFHEGLPVSVIAAEGVDLVATQLPAAVAPDQASV